MYLTSLTISSTMACIYLICLITLFKFFIYVHCSLDSSALKPMISDNISNKSEAGLFGFSLPKNPFKLFSEVPCISSALQPGTCEEIEQCKKNGGFGDGKGLCLKDKFCCVHGKKCGEVGLFNNTVFSSPDYPKSTRKSGQCVYKVKLLPFVHTLRIYFVEVKLHQPDYYTGVCNTDALWIEGADKSFSLSKLCGVLSGTHIYVPVKKSLLKHVTIHVALSQDDYDRKWLLKVEQYKENSEIPPDHCLQYYVGESGTITSFNVDPTNQTGLGNINGLKYSACIRQEEGFCKIVFEPNFFNLGYSKGDYYTRVYYNRVQRSVTQPPSMNRYFYKFGAKPTQGFKPVSSVSPNMLHSYHPANKPMPVYTLMNKPSNLPIKFEFNCKNNDVLVLPLSDDGNPAVHCGALFHNTPSLVSSSSPFMLFVNNKGLKHGKGFSLKYKQLVC